MGGRDALCKISLDKSLSKYRFVFIVDWGQWFICLEFESLKMLITIYSKPACVQCNATYRALDSKGINYEVIDISQDEQAYGLVQAMGYRQVPVVVSGDQHWAGFRPDMINALSI